MRDVLTSELLLGAVPLALAPLCLLGNPVVRATRLTGVAFLGLYTASRVTDAARHPLAVAVRGFRTVARPTIVVHHDPAVEPLDAVVTALVCERELADLGRAFGFRLRYWRFRRPRVYLFRAITDLAPVFGGPVGGWADGRIGAIVCGSDQPTAETVRHEFAHLFAAAATRAQPPQVVVEGLAVWAQRTNCGHGIHACARRWLKPGVVAIDALPVAWRYGADPIVHRNYLMAGSFTGYLIGRHGWPAYWRFYRTRYRTEPGFRAAFRRHYGLSFAAARDDWFAKLSRGELTGKPGRDSFEPA